MVQSAIPMVNIWYGLGCCVSPNGQNLEKIIDLKENTHTHMHKHTHAQHSYMHLKLVYTRKTRKTIDLKRREGEHQGACLKKPT